MELDLNVVAFWHFLQICIQFRRIKIQILNQREANFGRLHQVPNADAKYSFVIENLHICVYFRCQCQWSQSWSRPVAVVLGCREDVSQVFLVVENEALPITFGVVSAVEWMMKLYFILNMEYPSECKHILHFLQTIVLGLEDALPLARSAIDLSVFIRNKHRRN